MISLSFTEDSIIPRKYVASRKTWAYLKARAQCFRDNVFDALMIGDERKSKKFLAAMLALADAFDNATKEIDTATSLNAPADAVTSGRLPF